MTATDGGPALEGADAAAPAGGAGPGVTARRQAPRLRTLLGIARVEASLLSRSKLVLAGLAAGGAMVWVLTWPTKPLWWNAAWVIGDGQLVLATAVLAAAQLASGRARRDGMADLYASFPATAGTRILGQLAGLAGAAPVSLVLIGAAAALVQLLGAIGAPSIAVLAGGLLLAIAAGATGIAIGTRFPHPLAGVLGALALFLVSSQAGRFSGAVIWVLPWEINQDQLGFLPGPLTGYPPAGAHLVELAGLAVLAAVAASAATVSRARARGGLATVGILAAAAICLAGAAQLRPIPAADLNHLAREAANPASLQRCTSANQVRYCLYPGFGSLLPSVEAPVNGVLGHLPARPDRPLTVSQVLSLSLPDSTLTHGHPKRQVSQWDAQLQAAPVTAAAASAIYLPVGSWPAASGQLTDAHFNVALATAEWAVHLPLTTTSGQPCVPFDQGREAIAIWLAILTTHPRVGELQAGLPAGGFAGVEVHNTFVPTWTYPGQSAGQVDQLGAGPPQTTAAGYLLARAMATLPERKVAHVLKADWGRWMNWRTTDAQLAAALGIRMPTVPVPAIHPTPPPGVTINPGAGDLQSPVCGS